MMNVDLPAVAGLVDVVLLEDGDRFQKTLRAGDVLAIPQGERGRRAGRTGQGGAAQPSPGRCWGSASTGRPGS